MIVLVVMVVFVLVEVFCDRVGGCVPCVGACLKLYLRTYNYFVTPSFVRYPWLVVTLVTQSIFYSGEIVHALIETFLALVRASHYEYFFIVLLEGLALCSEVFVRAQ